MNDIITSSNQGHEDGLISGTFSQRDRRSLIINLLYAMDSFDYETSLESIVDNLQRGFNINIAEDPKIVSQAQAIINDRVELDNHIVPLLDNWKFERLGVCTKLILRLAIWEIINEKIEPAVIINEAVELAKCFAEKDAYKFINGILDEFVKKLQENTK